MKNIWEKLVGECRAYCRKNGFEKVCLGLSGGIDSAICSMILKEAIGSGNVYAYMMKTKYTSELSVEIAKKISQINGFNYQEIDIQNQVDMFENSLGKIFFEKPKDLVMQNVQARIRGQILMAISNQFGYLVVACGNKSEAAMGYCTLYGDTCGGIMPIGDLYKTDVYRLANYINSIYGEVLPAEVVSRPPTAELKLNQKDEDSLPPYLVLDKVLFEYVDCGKNLAEIVNLGYDLKVVDFIINKYEANEFKRMQLPEILKV